MNKKDITIGIVGLALLGTTVAGLTGWHSERQQVNSLKAQLADAQLQEKRSTVVRSISRQMEDIAYQQKEISDEQREEAIQQKRTADEMRQRSEVERMNALVAQQQAMESEKQAQEALQIAENERQIAEHQRIQAELSKRMTDTLSYVALARSLGSLSSTQAQVGNTELADLLAYASHHYASRYHGDVYYPAIYQSLMTASQSMKTWSEHNGWLMNMGYMSEDDDRIVTCSTYGEVKIHKKIGEQLRTETLLNNKNYDFRDIYIDEGVIYVVSRNGHLAIIEKGTPRVIDLPGLAFPISMTELDKDNLILVGEHGLAQYNKQQKMIVATKELDFKITNAGRYNYMPALFDDQGRMHLVKDLNTLITSDNPVRGRVTAFASSKNTKQRAYGMSDGTIYLYDEQTGKTTKLEAHLSRISKLKMNGNRLYSSSYDGTVKLWLTVSDKIVPITLISAGSWITNFSFDASKNYIWIGDQNGDLTVALLSVPMMVERIRNKLKRDFTTDEWNYYIGRNVPYESFLTTKGKGVAK